MRDRSPGPVSAFISLVAAIAAAATLPLSSLPVSADWIRFHGDAANSGFVDRVTAPAKKRSRSAPGFGTFAPGTGPVIGPDVYLGTEQGKLIHLHRTGDPGWTSDRPHIFGVRPSIVASPAVGSTLRAASSGSLGLG
jgi:hypothetical protein